MAMEKRMRCSLVVVVAVFDDVGDDFLDGEDGGIFGAGGEGEVGQPVGNLLGDLGQGIEPVQDLPVLFRDRRHGHGPSNLQLTIVGIKTYTFKYKKGPVL
jgi:hypothetical protein